jgi:cobalamin biosynthesis Mg chelatase CobN
VRDRLVDHLMGAIVVVWVGILVALALGGCATTRSLHTKETAKTTWHATESTASQVSSTSVKAAASRKVRNSRRTEKRPDGTVVTTDTTTTTDSGVTTSTTAQSASASQSTAGGEATASASTDESRSSKPSAIWLPWWCWVVLAAVVAGGVGLTIYRWGPGLWMRLVTRIRP